MTQHQSKAAPAVRQPDPPIPPYIEQFGPQFADACAPDLHLALLVTHFAAYVMAVRFGEYSKATEPRNALANAGYEVTYRPKGGAA